MRECGSIARALCVSALGCDERGGIWCEAGPFAVGRTCSARVFMRGGSVKRRAESQAYLPAAMSDCGHTRVCRSLKRSFLKSRENENEHR